MNFIDSTIIAYAFYKNEKQLRCHEILKEGGVINTLNLIEAYNIIQYETNSEHANESIRSLLKSNLVIIGVDINLIFEALKRSSKYPKLKIFDLIHYITALMNNCRNIASFDSDFDGLEIKRIT